MKIRGEGVVLGMTIEEGLSFLTLFYAQILVPE